MSVRRFYVVGLDYLPAICYWAWDTTEGRAYWVHRDGSIEDSSLSLDEMIRRREDFQELDPAMEVAPGL